MRKIKFRGYDGMDWIYSMSIDYDKENDIWYMLDYTDDEWMVVNKIGQYIGWEDNKGKEIYEGDIVHAWGGEYHSGYWEHDKTITIQDIRQEAFELSFYENVEIIGNVYEI